MGNRTNFYKIIVYIYDSINYKIILYKKVHKKVGMNSDTIITLHYPIVMHGLTLAKKVLFSAVEFFQKAKRDILLTQYNLQCYIMFNLFYYVSCILSHVLAPP